MKKQLLLFFGFVAGSFSLNAQTGVYVPELAAFDTAMLSLMNTYNVPGGQLAISYEGRLVYNRGFGLANIPTHDSVQPDHMFRIASISKTITGVACMKLHEEGILDLDAKVFGPNGILNDAMYQSILDPRDTMITVRMLLHHSGGWNSAISGDVMFNAYNIATIMGVPSPPSAEVTIQYVLGNVLLDFTPGTQSAYSNFGYCVLGRVIEKLTDMSYNDYVRSEILDPLGMNETHLGFNLEVDRLPKEVSYYHHTPGNTAYSVYDNSTLVPWPYGGFNLEFMDAHGGWVASAENLVRFLCGFDRFPTRPDLLTNASIDTLTEPSEHDPNYAFGIGVNQFGNWWHLGSLPGTTSEIVRSGSRKLNWAILFNTRDAAGNINAAMDNLVWSVLPTISNWPNHNLFSDSTVSVSEYNKPARLSVYPNPARTEITISLPENNGKTFSISIYNAVGQQVAQYRFSGVQQTISINVSELAAGMYVLHAIDADQQQYREKITIVK